MEHASSISRKIEDKQPSNLTPRDGEEGGDGVKGYSRRTTTLQRVGETGRTTSSTSRRLVVIGLQVLLYSSLIAAVQQQARRSGEEEQVDRS